MVMLRLRLAVGTLLLAASTAFGLPADSQGWWSITTPHFDIVTDSDPELAAELGVSLERFRLAFSRLSPELGVSSPVPTSIFVFRDSESFARYRTSEDRSGSTVVGQFVSQREGNYILLDAGSRRVSSLAVIYHEYVHDLLRHNFPEVPLWLHEGLAEYYSTFLIEGEAAVIGLPVERHLRWLAQEGDFGLEDVLSAGSESHLEPGQTGRFYAVSWALVHYLLSGGEERLSRVADLLVRLHDGQPAAEAFRQAFRASPRELEDELRRYVAAGSFPSSAVPLSDLDSWGGVDLVPLAEDEALVGLGRLLAHTGRREAAERHLRLALDTRPRLVGALAGLAWLRDLEGRLVEAESLYREALEAGPADPLDLLHWGSHQLLLLEEERGKSGPARLGELAEEARRSFGEALSLNPEFAEARAMLGYAHLFGEADAGAGTVYLEQARRLLPARLDLVFYLVLLRVREGEFERAERLVDEVLSGRAGEEMILRARQEVARGRLLHASRAAVDEGRFEEGADLLDEAISLTTDERLRAEMEQRLEALRRSASRP